MIDLYEELSAVSRALADAQLPYALCGGLAAAVHGYVRATEAIDLLVREQDLEEIKACLRNRGYVLDSGVMPVHRSDGTSAIIHRIGKSEGSDFLQIDLLVVDEVLDDVWAERSEHELANTRICCVSRSGLIAMKRNAGRAIDLADIERLTDEG